MVAAKGMFVLVLEKETMLMTKIEDTSCVCACVR